MCLCVGCWNLERESKRERERESFFMDRWRRFSIWPSAVNLTVTISAMPRK